MSRFSVQGLIALILVGPLTLALADTPAIGVAVTSGSFQVENSRIYGNTTVFDGTTIQTERTSSHLELGHGTKMELGGNSRAKIYGSWAALERGLGQLETSSNYQMEARTLRISPIDGKAIARVKLEGERQVLVTAVNGRVRVLNEKGLLVANMEPGIALLFTPQAAQPGVFQMSGCLLQTADAKFFLMDANQTVELRGSDLAREMNNRVEVTGTAFRSAVPTAPASQVVQVDSLKQAGAGGCLESITKLETSGKKVLRSGQAPSNSVTKPKSHAGIYAGVGIAAAGGIGAAVALGGKSSTSR